MTEDDKKWIGVISAITQGYIADSRSTNESCGALGQYTRTALNELGDEYEGAFAAELVKMTEKAVQEMMAVLAEELEKAHGEKVVKH